MRDGLALWGIKARWVYCYRPASLDPRLKCLVTFASSWRPSRILGRDTAAVGKKTGATTSSMHVPSRICSLTTPISKTSKPTASRYCAWIWLSRN